MLIKFLKIANYVYMGLVHMLIFKLFVTITYYGKVEIVEYNKFLLMVELYAVGLMAFLFAVLFGKEIISLYQTLD